MKKIFFIIGLIIMLTGCAPENAPSPKDKPKNTNGEMQIPEEGFRIESLQKYFFTNQYSIEIKGDYLVIKNNLKEMKGKMDQKNKQYIFDFNKENIDASCSAPLEFNNNLKLNCTIQGIQCAYDLKKDEKTSAYIPGENKNCIEAGKKLLNKPLISKFDPSLFAESSLKEKSKLWDRECDKYKGEDPEICPNIVHKEKNDYSYDYYFKDACFDPQKTIKTADGLQADSTNLLKVDMIYTASEQEGCFLFWCNGPWGNFHIVLTPYRPEFAGYDPGRFYQEILLADDRGESTTLNEILQGPYLSRSPSNPDSEEDRQCEFYEAEVVGPQRVYYDHKQVWDWDWNKDKICTCDSCQHAIMFTIYESDEWFYAHDPIATGTITYEAILLQNQLKKPLKLAVAGFEISFSIENPKPLASSGRLPADPEQQCKEPANEKICNTETAFAQNTATPLGKSSLDYSCINECEEFRDLKKLMQECEDPNHPDPIDCKKNVQWLYDFCTKRNFDDTCSIASHSMIEVWEYACVKHLNNCDYVKAENNLKTMNMQCGKKFFKGSRPYEIKMIKGALEEARAKKREAAAKGIPFICDSEHFEKRDTSYINCIK